MKYTVVIEDYPNKEYYTFTNRQEAKDFFRAEQRKPSYKSGTAYDEDHISIFADENRAEIPTELLDTLSHDCGSLGRKK